MGTFQEAVFVEAIVRGEDPPHPLDTFLVVIRDTNGIERIDWRERLIALVEEDLRRELKRSSRQPRGGDS